MRMRAAFVPVDGAHVAVTLSLPDGPARGLAVLLQGFGATRSHRNRLWTKTSAALAGAGIASVRLDYPGLGDSTGVLEGGMREPPLAAVIAATQLGQEVTGVRTFCAVGNCLGARTALLLARRLSGCVGVGLILPGELESISNDRPSTGIVPKLKGIARRIPPLRRLRRWARSIRHRSGGGGVQLMPEVREVMESIHMLFLVISPRDTWRRLAPALGSRPGGRRSGERGRIERVFVPVSSSHGLQPLSSQEAVLRVVPDWVIRTVEASAGSGRVQDGLLEDDGALSSDAMPTASSAGG